MTNVIRTEPTQAEKILMEETLPHVAFGVYLQTTKPIEPSMVEGDTGRPVKVVSESTPVLGGFATQVIAMGGAVSHMINNLAYGHGNQTKAYYLLRDREQNRVPVYNAEDLAKNASPVPVASLTASLKFV